MDDKKLEQLLKKLDEADKAYHSDDDEIMSDAEYNLLKDRVFKFLPPDHPRLSKVGHPVCSDWPKENHEIFMGSQDKVSTVETIEEWVKNIYKLLGTKDVDFVLQPKIDGFSLQNSYKNGDLIKSLTRGGGGGFGENIIQNAKLFRYIPNKLEIKNNLSVRGEGLLYKEDYDTIQKLTNNHYKSIRSSAAGIGRRYDGNYSKYVRYFAYDITGNMGSETQKIETLKKLGFVPVITYKCKSIKEIIDIYVDYRDNKREKLFYAIDGLVLKTESIALQNKLGIKNNRPIFSVALKFDSDQVATTVLGIKPQVGRTGRITPVVLLDKVDLMGASISKASIHNYSMIHELGVGVGCEVSIQRCGDIIPQVVDVLVEGEPFINPTFCPSCGSPLYDDEVNLWCKGYGCKEKEVNRITYWLEALDIKGFSSKFIDKLWDSGKIKSVGDLYKIKPIDLENLEGIGAKTIKGFFKVLKDNSELLLTKFITALGVPGVSSSTAEVLVKNFKTWDKIRSLKPIEIEALYGFAETSAASICEGIAEVKEMADELLKAIKIKEVKAGALTGKTFCITGSLNNMGRKEAEKLIVENGGSFKSGVVEGMSYLITNDKTSNSEKNRKAQQYKIPVINEEEFLKLIDYKPIEKKENKGEVLEAENLFE